MLGLMNHDLAELFKAMGNQLGHDPLAIAGRLDRGGVDLEEFREGVGSTVLPWYVGPEFPRPGNTAKL